MNGGRHEPADVEAAAALLDRHEARRKGPEEVVEVADPYATRCRTGGDPVDHGRPAVKVLSLLEPWASLVAWGYKKVETRSWGTPYRGTIAIHASKNGRHAGEVVRLFREAGLCRDRDASGPDDELDRFSQALGEWPLGKIVAVARLYKVERMTPELIAAQTRLESTFGDWRPGRFAWSLGNVWKLKEPIPWRGSLGLRDLPAEVEAQAWARCA
jgi:activating signal cointegrator 1